MPKLQNSPVPDNICLFEEYSQVPENKSEPISFRPSGHYFRKAVRSATAVDKLREISLVLCFEHERLRSWVREQGYIPPKWQVTVEEAEAKGWL